MTDKPNIYVGECTLISNDYKGKAVTISMKGCSLSTTHISMTLKPDQQKVLREYLMRDVIEELERLHTLYSEGSNLHAEERLWGEQLAIQEALNLIKNGVKK